jgi:hypothetical protein
MAVVGSPFVEQLLAAIRARGARLALGLVPTAAATEEAAPLGVPVRNGTAGTPTLRVARHPVGRLLARVLVRAGAALEEHLVEGTWVDLATGAPLPADAAATCAAFERGVVDDGIQRTLPFADEPRASTDGSRVASNGRSRVTRHASVGRAGPRPSSPGPALAPARPTGELVDLMVADLRARLAPRVDQLRAEAEHALAAELARIDRYFRALLEDAGARGDGESAAAAGRAIEAEHARRRLEEERRHQVRAIVHPLQLVEMELVVQRAEWTLSTPAGRTATLSARRALSGGAAWSLTCPTCAREPEALVVCRDGRIGCDACARECSVCRDGFRASEGADACHVDGSPACADHARTCSSCRRPHCSKHEGECADGPHRACTGCLARCEGCGRRVCASHTVRSAAAAPMGSRRLCAECVVHCEGGRNEPVGRDEAVRCASCERFVCGRHQASCDVDGEVHCSSHLARADWSRRLVCERDRATCAHEPEAIFAVDEVTACPVCARRACSTHLRECAHCGRPVCVGEWEDATRRCATCRRLAPYPAPSEAERAAAADAGGGDVPKPRRWRAARDATHVVIELTHGWKRRTVLAVRHGDARAETVVSHTRRGAERKR